MSDLPAWDIRLSETVGADGTVTLRAAMDVNGHEAAMTLDVYPGALPELARMRRTVAHRLLMGAIRDPWGDHIGVRLDTRASWANVVAADWMATAEVERLGIDFAQPWPAPTEATP